MCWNSTHRIESFQFMQAVPVSVWYSISAAHHTPWLHLEGFAWVGSFYFFGVSPVAFAHSSPWVITDWVPANRLGIACLVLSDGCFVLSMAGARQDFTPVWSHWRIVSFGSWGRVPVGMGAIWRWACLTCSGIKKPGRMCFLTMWWRFCKFLP